MSTVESVAISRINDDPTGIQPRTELDGDAVRAYAEMYESGEATFPAVSLAKIQGEAAYRIVDGYHRIAACKSINAHRIRAHITEYDSWAQMASDAAKANGIHGVALTREDRTQTLLSLLRLHEDEGRHYTVQSLAQAVGLPRTTASGIIRRHTDTTPEQGGEPEEQAADSSGEPEPKADAPDTPASREFTYADPIEPEPGTDDKTQALRILHDRKLEFEAINRHVAEARDAIKRVIEKPGGEDLNRHSGVIHKMEEIRKLIMATKPDRVCEACEGVGGDCEVCKGERVWCKAFAKQRDEDAKD